MIIISNNYYYFYFYLYIFCIIVIIIIIIIKNESIKVTLCENAAGALFIVNKMYSFVIHKYTDTLTHLHMRIIIYMLVEDAVLWNDIILCHAILHNAFVKRPINTIIFVFLLLCYVANCAVLHAIVT